MRTLGKTVKYGIGSLLMAAAVWFILALPGFLSDSSSTVPLAGAAEAGR